MAKNSGGTRKKYPSQKKYEYEFAKESEKAVMMTMKYSIEIAPRGGYVSSQVKYRNGAMNVWVPKSQIQDGKISDWIAQQKAEEANDWVLSKFSFGQVISNDVHFFDKNDKEIEKATSKKQQAFEKGVEKHQRLYDEAKKLGIKGVRIKMKSATLETKIKDFKNSATID